MNLSVTAPLRVKRGGRLTLSDSIGAVWQMPHRLFVKVLVDADAGEGEFEPDAGCIIGTGRTTNAIGEIDIEDEVD